tara:strand:+ start:783 stop:1499 length:717 start_codon:yes stop_codon:yes gene_type:complete
MSKLIELNGTYNLRDLGGISKQVKDNVLFRSDRLSELCENDIVKLKSLGIKRIIDLRSVGEIESHKDKYIEGIENIALPISLAFTMDELNAMDENGVLMVLEKANEELITKHFKVLEKFLNLLLDPIPTIFHCTSGKDRTGFATLLIYHILGISIEDIMLDYMNSNDYLKPRLEEQFTKINIDIKFKPLMFVEERYINKAINVAKEKYGSIDNFISDKLNFKQEKRDKLRQNYLLSKY